MFAQANSEHCRHKVFNADWLIDGARAPKSLFAMIRNTYAHAPDGVLSAYKDNAAVVAGAGEPLVRPGSEDGRLRVRRRARASRHEGGDAQPSDRDLAVPGRSDRVGRRDPRRGRDGPRREAEGRPDWVHGVAPRDSGLASAVGARAAGQARSHRVAAVDHARRPDRRRELQQRVRPAESRGLFPHGAGVGRRRVARLSQADHDRGRPRQRAARERREGRAGTRREARRARRPRDADRARRRRGLVARERLGRGGARLRIRAARQRRDAAARSGSHRRVHGARR